MTSNIIAWTILITENTLLLGLILIWINRECSQCKKVKCIERILNKLCSKCKDKSLEKAKPKKTVSIF